MLQRICETRLVHDLTASSIIAIQGGTNTKKKKKEKQKAKEQQYRAERMAVARYEQEDRQIRLLASSPPSMLVSMQQQRAHTFAARLSRRPDMRLRAAPAAIGQEDAVSHTK